MKMLAAKGVLEGLKPIDVGPCENCVMSKHKRVSFTRIARELKKVRLEMVHTDVEQGSKTTKQVGVELELQGYSPSDVVAGTQETPETVAEEPAVEQVTPKSVLRRSSSTIRVPDMYVPSLHYLLLMKWN